MKSFVNLRPRSLFSQLLFTYLMLIIVTLLLIGLLFNRLVSQYLISYGEWERLNQVNKAVGIVTDQLEPWERASLSASISTLAVSFDSQIWVIDPSGKLIAQSQASPDEQALTLSNEEIARVLKGESVSKKSVAEHQQETLIALPLFSRADPSTSAANEQDKEIVGAIVMRSPAGSIASSIRDVMQLIINAMLVAVCISIIIGWMLSKNLLRPLQRMSRIALKVASGNFEERVNVLPDRTPTEIHQIIATFNYAVDQIEDQFRQERSLERMRRDFVANVSHEFKGPLTSIRGFLELMAENRLTDEEKKKYLRLVLGNLAHLNYLVEDLLDLSQLESGKVTLHREALAPSELLWSAYEEVLDLSAQKNIQLQIISNTKDEVPPVWVDRHRFRQVLQNLIHNALRHTPSGGTIQLETVSNREHAVEFRITDSGEGIDPEDLPRIWDRFYKADKAHTRSEDGGTGLGLAIVKQIVELHGGSISVQSQVGRGTCFTVIIPRPPSSVADGYRSSEDHSLLGRATN